MKTELFVVLLVSLQSINNISATYQDCLDVGPLISSYNTEYTAGDAVYFILSS